MTTLLKCKLSVFFVFIFLIELHGQSKNQSFKHSLEENQKPWTNKPFYNDPYNFQFAIVSDRTGGHREGVFEKGIEKINQLYPEFVISVGDLIEGYTKDTTLLNEHWNEFHKLLAPLNTKFFYVAGNHDYSNDVMAKQWKNRYGRDYYHFIYKDVLFLIANSNDGDGVIMNNDQINYLKKAIAQNPEVRWTMLFVHHPMWVFGKVNGFNEIENTLKGRDYSVFAGHTHRYLHTVKNDQNHYILGTTGGGSKLRGPKFGEFDHISWVTMTDSGPRLVNLALSGIHDDDISNKNTKEQAIALIKATDFKPLVLSKKKERKIIISLTNPSDKKLIYTSKLYHHHQVIPDVSNFDLVLEPNSSQQLTIVTNSTGKFNEKDWDPLELEWKMSYDSEFMEPDFSLNGVEIIELNSTIFPNISLTNQNIFLNEHHIVTSFPYNEDNLTIRYTIDGSEPRVDSKIIPESLPITNTTNLKVIVTDSQGFKSNVVTKNYKKVQPLKNIKVKIPKKGLSYVYYEGDFTTVPNFDAIGNPIKSGIVEELDPDKIGQRLDHFAIQYEGYIKVSETNVYDFHLRSDDGAILHIDDKLIINNDGSHDTKKKSGYVALKKGWHSIRIDYFEDFLGEHLELNYSSNKLKNTKPIFWH